MNPTPLNIAQGKTFQTIFRWGILPYVYKPITAITQTGPVSITAASHGLTSNWPVAIVSVKGMSQINAAHNPPRDTEMHKCTVVDPNTITINDINTSLFSAYTSGGYLQYYTPVSLAGYTARMSIKDKVGGTELLRLDTVNSRIAIDDTAKTISLTIDATTAAAAAWTKGVYDIEMVSPTGVVDLLAYGPVTMTTEVTTT